MWPMSWRGVVAWWLAAAAVGLALSASAQAASTSEQNAVADSHVLQRESVLTQLRVQMLDAQRPWAQLLHQAGIEYRPLRLDWRDAGSGAKRVRGDISAPAACDEALDWGGMRYCAAQDAVFMDMRYLDDWAQQASDRGDDARAYVLAHVLAHHVQNLLGVTDKLTQWQLGHSRRWRKDLHLRVELQADCLAGLWFQRSAPLSVSSQPQRVSQTMQRVALWHHDDQRGGGEHVGSMLLIGGAALHEKWFARGLSATGVEDCDTFIDEQL